MDYDQFLAKKLHEGCESGFEPEWMPEQLFPFIERAVVLWSNPGEVVFTPFMGVGSEVYQAVKSGRKGIGVELKQTYYNQACRNVENAAKNCDVEEIELKFETKEQQ